MSVTQVSWIFTCLYCELCCSTVAFWADAVYFIDSSVTSEKSNGYAFEVPERLFTQIVSFNLHGSPPTQTARVLLHEFIVVSALIGSRLQAL